MHTGKEWKSFRSCWRDSRINKLTLAKNPSFSL
jgi:hypothetical protein